MKVKDVIKELSKHDLQHDVVIPHCTKKGTFTALTLKHIHAFQAHKEEDEEKKEYILHRAAIWPVLAFASFEEPKMKNKI